MRTEGYPEVVQFSGGEPTIHPDILPMLRAAKARNIRHVMINTNGKRIATDDAFLEELAEIQPAIYVQFDGFLGETYCVIRGEPDILSEKLRGLCWTLLASSQTWSGRACRKCHVDRRARASLRREPRYGPGCCVLCLLC